MHTRYNASRLIVSCFIAACVSTPLYSQDISAPGISLHIAAFAGNLETVRQHIDAGSDLNTKDIYGSTPLIIAITFDKTEVAKALIDAGADITTEDNTGSTPLHVAAFFCREEIVRVLLDKGADRFRRNNSGSSAYDIVATPFEDDKKLYDELSVGLAQTGFRLDYDRIREARPVIAEMLRSDCTDLEVVGFAPIAGRGWKVSKPAEQGLDSMLVKELYLDAAHMKNLYGLLLIKNGYVVAEKYFNAGSIDRNSLVQSVSKSYIAALVGIALDQGCIMSLDQRMMEFFPEFDDEITDPRKREITIRDMLQMRAGYLWEELDTVIWRKFTSGNQRPLLSEIPLVNDPGAGFNYSNITSYLLGVIVQRACGTDLKAFAQERLLTPIESGTGDWYQDKDGYYYSFFGFTLRDMARLGMLYFNEGIYRGKQVLSSDWIDASLRRYSDDAWITHDRLNSVGRYFKDLNYGYQWWSARVGDHSFDFAWGHGGQLIILLHDVNMIIVVSSDPHYMQHNDTAWGLEQGNFNLVGKFISLLSRELDVRE